MLITVFILIVYYCISISVASSKFLKSLYKHLSLNPHKYPVRKVNVTPTIQIRYPWYRVK